MVVSERVNGAEREWAQRALNSHDRVGRERAHDRPPYSSMATPTKLASQLHKIAAQWPVDPFRPHLRLKNFLVALADHPRLTPEAIRAARALEGNEFQKKVCSLAVLSVSSRLNICDTVPFVGEDLEASINAALLHQAG